MRAYLPVLWMGLWLLPAFLRPASVTYTADASDFSNPERGFAVTDYYWGPGNAQNRAISLSTLNSDKASNPAGESNITLIRRVYVLSAYSGVSLDSTVLNDISNDFAAARSLQIKLVPRFAYNWVGQNGSGSADAPQAVIVNHISQLAPILAANEDVIAYVEAGFIGQWGEWHDSTNGLTTAGNNNATAAMSAILNAELAALPADRMIAVRYPGYTLQIFGTTSPISAANAYDGSNYSRIGVHDDCFEVDAYDAGTYQKGATLGWSNAQFKSFLGQQLYSISVGGETCGANDPYSSCANSTADLSSMHWSMLNSQYDSANLTEWSSGGCLSSIKTGLGYRFRLTQSTLPATAILGGPLALSFQVSNDGFANCYNPRNLEIILRPSGQSGVGTAIPVSESAASNTDPRFWLPGQSFTVNISVTVPGSLAAGNYDVLLNLPDGKASLYGLPGYAIRLADTGLWESGTGYNKLNQSISLGSCGGCTATPTPLPTNTPVAGSVISIDFIGGSTANGSPVAMGAAEIAGVVPAANWNGAPASSGSLGVLVDNNGGATSASGAWSAPAGIWSTQIIESAGNNRMMKGYIDAQTSQNSSVQVNNLPALFSSGGYSVYVYFDGDNGTASRQGLYSIGASTLTGTDAPNANFAGSFTQSVAGGNGNYVLFTGLSLTSFTLSAAVGSSTDIYLRAPINGIQIVAYGGPSPSPSPTSTQTRTATPSPSITPTFTQSPQLSPTPSPSVSPSFTASPSFSITPTASPSPSPLGSPGPGTGKILKLLPLPNPNPNAAMLLLDGSLSEIELRVYTQAMIRAEAWDMGGNWQNGWNRLSLPPGALRSLPNGHYYLWARAKKPLEGSPQIASLYIMR